MAMIAYKCPDIEVRSYETHLFPSTARLSVGSAASGSRQLSVLSRTQVTVIDINEARIAGMGACPLLQARQQSR